MKLIALHEAKAKLSEYVAVSQKQHVLITSHGKPAALVVGVQGESIEDLLTRTDPLFWAMIERARKGPTVPLEEAERSFAAADEFEKRRGRPMSRAEARRHLAGAALTPPWIAEVPDLEIITTGGSKQEALRNAKLARRGVLGRRRALARSVYIIRSLAAGKAAPAEEVVS